MTKQVCFTSALLAVVSLAFVGCSKSSRACRNRRRHDRRCRDHSHEELVVRRARRAGRSLCPCATPSSPPISRPRAIGAKSTTVPIRNASFAIRKSRPKFAALYEAKYGKQPPKPE